MFAYSGVLRICPGRYFAEASLFINIAMVLHVFDITPPLDENGRVTPIQLKMTNRIVSYAVLFQHPRHV